MSQEIMSVTTADGVYDFLLRLIPRLLAIVNVVELKNF